MEQIAVNEYVRTNGRLYKVLDMDNVFLYVDKEVRYSEEYNASIDYIKRDEVEKHSPNIIDLIEVGDYVNGCRVSDLGDGLHLEFDYGVSFVDVGLSTYTDGHIEGIKSILTKEMYTANCYEVK